MKVIIEIDDCEENKLRRLTNIDGAFKTLWDITQHLRNEYKYNNDAPTEYLEQLREKIQEIMYDNDIDLDRDYK